jgi:hypothetical protein
VHASRGTGRQELATTDAIGVMRQQGGGECQLSNQLNILYQPSTPETLVPRLGSYRCDLLPQANVPGTLSNRQLNIRRLGLRTNDALL